MKKIKIPEVTMVLSIVTRKVKNPNVEKLLQTSVEADIFLQFVFQKLPKYFKRYKFAAPRLLPTLM